MSVDALLESARAARARGEGDRCIADLRQARAHTEDDRQVTIAWRLAKAEHDFGDAAGVLDALTPLVELEAPFAGSSAALAAVEVLSRQIRDHLGYDSAVPDALLARAAAEWREREDPIRALWVEVQRAWSLACRGELAALFGLLSEAERIRRKDVRHAPSRHARASDAGTSLSWMQLDLARAALRGATWAEDRARIRAALESIEDAAEEAGLRRLGDPWFLEAVVAGSWVAEVATPADYVAAWPLALASVEPPRRGLHDALHQGLSLLHGDPDPTPLLRAAEVAHAHALGPEWEAWSLQLAAAAGDEPAVAALSRVIARAGVSVFARSDEAR